MNLTKKRILIPLLILVLILGFREALNVSAFVVPYAKPLKVA
jgi:hypothetical protein